MNTQHRDILTTIGRKQVVKGAPKFGYLCAGCAK